MLTAVVGGLLAGCSTVTTMHYDLKSSAESAATSSTSNAAINYRLASVEVPESIDVSTLIVRQPDNSLMVLSHDKWVGSLGEALRNGVTAGLSRELGLPPLPDSMLPSQPSNSTTEIAIKIEQFDMQPARQASLAAIWQVTPRGPNRQKVTCYTVWSEKVEPGVAALVAAQQRNVQKLSAQIADTIKTGKTPTTGNCQVGKA